jgi:oxamate amidohydrolase
VTHLFPWTATGGHYAIATPHTFATEAGEAMFRAGGSAVDAALAASAALTVISPHRSSIGGDLMALIAHPDGDATAVNGTGSAAHRVSPDTLRAHARAMPVRGPETITVPGAVNAWDALAGMAGRLPLGHVLGPAISLAWEGVPVSRSLARTAASMARELACDPGMAAVLLPGGRPLAEGSVLRQPALAQSLQTIADDGARALYAGDLGRMLLAGLRRLGSPLREDDLAMHATELTDPVQARFRGTEVLTAPPNSQGFVLLQVLLALGSLGALARGTPDLAALFRVAGRDRDRHLADPRRREVPTNHLLSREHVASLVERARTPAGVTPGRLELGGRDSVAVVAADDSGNAVSIIQSSGDPLGAGILEPATGIVCHNSGASFSLDPASPNVLEGGKRPAHNLMPVLLRRDGQLVEVQGAVGRYEHPQVHAELILRSAAAGAGPRALDRGPVADRDARAPAAGSLLRRRDTDGERPPPMVRRVVDGAEVIRRRPDGTLQATTTPLGAGAAAAG